MFFLVLQDFPCFFFNYSATFYFGELWFFHNTLQSKVAESLGKTWEIQQN